MRKECPVFFRVQEIGETILKCMVQINELGNFTKCSSYPTQQLQSVIIESLPRVKREIC